MTLIECKTLDDLICSNCLLFKDDHCVKENRSVALTDSNSHCGEGLWVVKMKVKDRTNDETEVICDELIPVYLERAVREILNSKCDEPDLVEISE
jgi:hypothetical protein